MINRNIWNILFNLKRHRMPICYIFSSKLILSASFFLIMYFVIMDCLLFSKAKHRGPFVNLDLNQTSKSSDLVSSLIKSNSNHLQQQHQSSSIFWPLPVKKIMMAHATHYVRSPIAEFFEYGIGFSELFPFISANIISLSHCALSVVSVRFLINDSLFWRQVGVAIFQFRNFLDSFDGVVYRAHAKKSTYKSHYGSIGYFVDAFSDVFGGLCLIGSLAIYFLKHRPLNKKYTKCFRTTDDQHDLTSLLENNNNNLPITSDLSSLSSSTSSLILVNHSSPGSPSSSGAHSPSIFPQSPTFHSPSALYEKNQQFKTQLNLFCQNNSLSNENKYYASKNNNYFIKDNHTNLFATKETILLSVGLLGLRLALSALFWDRSVHTYQDLLDSQPRSELHKQLQIQVLNSSITLFIMFAWRFMCALSLQDLILGFIFIDKIWEFIVKSQVVGWILLISLIILTELHVAEVRSICSKVY